MKEASVSSTIKRFLKAAISEADDSNKHSRWTKSTTKKYVFLNLEWTVPLSLLHSANHKSSSIRRSVSVPLSWQISDKYADRCISAVWERQIPRRDAKNIPVRHSKCQSFWIKKKEHIWGDNLDTWLVNSRGSGGNDRQGRGGNGLC